MDYTKKILVACPTYGGMNYCFNEFIEHVKNINYPNFKVLIVDNSRDKKFFREANKIKGINVLYDDTKEKKNIDRLISSRNKILSYAIEKDFDYLLMLDADVIVPSNIIQKLLSHSKDVVSGIYFNLLKIDQKPSLTPVCYTYVNEEIFLEFKKNNPNLNISKENLWRFLTKEEVESGKLIEVLLPSPGCVLLSRKALLSGAQYGIEKINANPNTTDDMKFFRELLKYGFKLYCDTSIYCQHRILEKYKKNNGQHPVFKTE